MCGATLQFSIEPKYGKEFNNPLKPNHTKPFFFLKSGFFLFGEKRNLNLLSNLRIFNEFLYQRYPSTSFRKAIYI